MRLPPIAVWLDLWVNQSFPPCSLALLHVLLWSHPLLSLLIWVVQIVCPSFFVLRWALSMLHLPLTFLADWPLLLASWVLLFKNLKPWLLRVVSQEFRLANLLFLLQTLLIRLNPLLSCLRLTLLELNYQSDLFSAAQSVSCVGLLTHPVIWSKTASLI